jgi:hypothetical protein
MVSILEPTSHLIAPNQPKLCTGSRFIVCHGVRQHISGEFRQVLKGGCQTQSSFMFFVGFVGLLFLFLFSARANLMVMLLAIIPFIATAATTEFGTVHQRPIDAAIIGTGLSPPITGPVCSIADYGAVGDNSTLATRSIQHTIDHCSAEHPEVCWMHGTTLCVCFFIPLQLYAISHAL